jgi:hypothetical protein
MMPKKSPNESKDEKSKVGGSSELVGPFGAPVDDGGAMQRSPNTKCPVSAPSMSVSKSSTVWILIFSSLLASKSDNSEC